MCVHRLNVVRQGMQIIAFLIRCCLSFQMDVDISNWFYFCISLPLFPGEMFKFYDFKMNCVFRSMDFICTFYKLIITIVIFLFGTLLAPFCFHLLCIFVSYHISFVQILKC